MLMLHHKTIMGDSSVLKQTNIYIYIYNIKSIEFPCFPSILFSKSSALQWQGKWNISHWLFWTHSWVLHCVQTNPSEINEWQFSYEYYNISQRLDFYHPLPFVTDNYHFLLKCRYLLRFICSFLVNCYFDNILWSPSIYTFHVSHFWI